MFYSKQKGSTLKGLIVGALAALLAIILWLTFVTNKSADSFKQPELANPQASQLEMLTPNNVPASAVAPVIVSATEMSAASQTASNTVSDIVLPETASIEAALAAANQSVPVATQASAPVATETNTVKVAPKKVYPSAEEIAQRKAQEAARKARIQAKEREKQKQKSAQASENKAENTHRKGSAVIQAGAYSSKDAAQEQRANLAMLGVPTQIVEVKSNGKTIYRVQTGKLSLEEVKRIEKTLKSNNIQSYTRH